MPIREDQTAHPQGLALQSEHENHHNASFPCKKKKGDSDPFKQHNDRYESRKEVITMELTGILAKFLWGTNLKDIPDKVIDVAKHHILDCLGVTIAGSGTPTGKIITNFVK